MSEVPENVTFLDLRRKRPRQWLAELTAEQIERGGPLLGEQAQRNLARLQEGAQLTEADLQMMAMRVRGDWNILAAYAKLRGFDLTGGAA